MKGDFSRFSFDPLRHYSAVLQQQGRVQLDADFNEHGAILVHHLRALAADLIGTHGGPEGSFRISPLLDDAGIEIRFQDDGADYRSGDHWLIPARAARGEVIWPRDPGGHPVARRPDGVDHHLAPLALVRREGDRVVAADCRREFGRAAREC